MWSLIDFSLYAIIKLVIQLIGLLTFIYKLISDNKLDLISLLEYSIGF